MCGIGGFVADSPLEPYVAHRLARALLFYSMERGRQSAGVWADGKLFKQAVCADTLIDRTEFDTIFDTPVRTCLTHTRMPTMGGRGDAQAQPFVAGSIVSVHNGMYSNYEELKRKWNIHKPSGVDSELVATFVEQYGHERLNEFLDSAFGSSACAIFREGNLYLARDGNPIWFCRINLHNNKLAVFASTKEILKSAVGHVWLFDSPSMFDIVTDDTLIHLAPSGHTEIARSSRAGGHGHYRGFRGEDWHGGWHRGYDNGYSDWPCENGTKPPRTQSTQTETPRTSCGGGSSPETKPDKTLTDRRKLARIGKRTRMTWRNGKMYVWDTAVKDWVLKEPKTG